MMDITTTSALLPHALSGSMDFALKFLRMDRSFLIGLTGSGAQIYQSLVKSLSIADS